MKVKICIMSEGYWRATLDNPPLNLYDPEMADELTALMNELEQNKDVKVIVFESAVPDFFMAHLDLVRSSELDMTPGPTGLSPWPDMAQRLQQAPFVTIAKVRGRARGVGSEFIQAMDIRFASRERTLLAQLEIGCGVFPGGGGLERLPLLIGRSRAMEVIMSGDDYDADTAERYGWINRAIPDDELDEFVDRFAQRVASFDKQAIATAKAIINQRVTMVQNNDLAYTQQKFFEGLNWPESQARLSNLFANGLQQAGDLELNISSYLAPEAVNLNEHVD